MGHWPWRTQKDAAFAQANARSHDPEGSDRRAVFERLAHEHARALYGAALRMTRNPDDAQDLLQDALVRAYAAFDSFAPDTNFRAWLLRIMTNNYITAYRRRQLVSFQSWDDVNDASDVGLAAFRGAPMDEPETGLLTRAMDKEIEEALVQLSEGVRLTVLLVDVEELSYEDAAAALEVPVGTVRSRLNRGREQMRRFLTDYARERRLA